MNTLAEIQKRLLKIRNSFKLVFHNAESDRYAFNTALFKNNYTFKDEESLNPLY